MRAPAHGPRKFMARTACTKSGSLLLRTEISTQIWFRKVLALHLADFEARASVVTSPFSIGRAKVTTDAKWLSLRRALFGFPGRWETARIARGAHHHWRWRSARAGCGCGGRPNLRRRRLSRLDARGKRHLMIATV